MKLYELSADLAGAIQKYQSVESDEDLARLEATLNDLQTSFNEKAVSVAFHIKNVDLDIAAIETELERLGRLFTRAKTEREWFMRYLKSSMETVGAKSVETSTIKVKIVNNPPSVVVEDEMIVPERFKRTKTITEVDKKLILESWKDGIGVEGTKVEQKSRISIK